MSIHADTLFVSASFLRRSSAVSVTAGARGQGVVRGARVACIPPGFMGTIPHANHVGAPSLSERQAAGLQEWPGPLFRNSGDICFASQQPGSATNGLPHTA